MLNFFNGHVIGIRSFKTYLSPKYFLCSSNMTLAVNLGTVLLSAFFVRQGGLRNEVICVFN
jgi:hypothetical protein